MDKNTKAREHIEELEKLVLPKDREELYLEVAQDVLREYRDGYRIPYETQREVARILSERKEVNIGIMAREVDMNLSHMNHGAKIHKIPSLQTALRGYHKKIDNGELPSHPLLLALEYPTPFGILFSSLCRAKRDHEIKL